MIYLTGGVVKDNFIELHQGLRPNFCMHYLSTYCELLPEQSKTLIKTLTLTVYIHLVVHHSLDYSRLARMIK